MRDESEPLKYRNITKKKKDVWQLFNLTEGKTTESSCFFLFDSFPPHNTAPPRISDEIKILIFLLLFHYNYFKHLINIIKIYPPATDDVAVMPLFLCTTGSTVSMLSYLLFFSPVLLSLITHSYG